MPISIQNLNGGEGVFIAAGGDLGDDEFCRAFRAQLSPEGDRPAAYRYCLADFGAVRQVPVSFATVERMARLSAVAERESAGAAAAIVASRDLVYGLARMWQLIKGEGAWDSRIFRSRPDAERWLKEEVSRRYGITGIGFGDLRGDGAQWLHFQEN